MAPTYWSNLCFLEEGLTWPLGLLGVQVGQTPLHYAARNCHLDVLDLLLSWGADHLMPDNVGLLPPLPPDCTLNTCQTSFHPKLKCHLGV